MRQAPQYDEEGEGFYRPTGAISSSKNNDKSKSKAGASDDNPETLDDHQDKIKGLAQNEANDLGFRYQKGGGKASYKLFKANRAAVKKYLVGAGLVGGIGGFFISLIFTLLPLKFEYITNLITDQVSTVPEYAIEKRVDYLVGQYIARSVLGADKGTDVYLGKGLAGTMFGNWRTANFEKKMLDDFGIEFRSLDRDRLGATRWQVLVDGNPIDVDGTGRFDLRRGEVRRVVRQAVRESTQWNQFLKRRTMRKMLQNKFDIPNWKVDVFGQKASNKVDDARESYILKKRAFYKYTHERTIGRLSTRMGLYFGCLTDQTKCDDLNDRSRTPDAPDADHGLEEVFDDVDIDAPDAEIPDFGSKQTASKVGDFIRKFGTRKVIGTAIGGIGIIDFISDLVEGVENGQLTQMSYAMNVDAAVGAANWVDIAVGQMNAGDVLGEDVQLLQERFDGFEASPVYAGLIGQMPEHGMFNSKVQAAPSSIARECFVDGEFTMVSLPPGQLACNDMLFYNPGIDAQIQSLPGWQKLVAVQKAYRKSAGFVFDAFQGLVEDIPYLQELTDSLLSIGGLDEKIGEGVDYAMGEIFSPGCIGGELDQLAFDCFYAGKEASYNEIAVSGGDLGIGGRALTDVETAAIFEEVEADRYEEFKQKSFFARLFDTTDYNSLLGQVVMRTPGNGEQLRTSIASAIGSPGGTMATAFSTPVMAAAQPVEYNPFNIIRYGYPTDDPAFEADWESPTLLACETNLEDQRAAPQLINEYVFPVLTTTDQCALERVSTNVLGCLFSNKDDCGVGTGQFAGGGDGVATGELVVGNTADIRCAAGTTDLGEETRAYKRGERYTIRLCEYEGARINSQISGNFKAIVDAMRADGVNYTSGFGFRTSDSQETLRRNNCANWQTTPSGACRPPTAKVGYSNHQYGVAIDLKIDGKTLCRAQQYTPAECLRFGDAKEKAASQWLKDNAATYGFEVLRSEAWHISYGGG